MAEPADPLNRAAPVNPGRRDGRVFLFLGGNQAFMTATWQPLQIILVMDGPDGQYALVTCIGGGIGITRDRVPLGGCRWHDDQTLACIEEFVRRCERDHSDRAPRAGSGGA